MTICGSQVKLAKKKRIGMGNLLNRQNVISIIICLILVVLLLISGPVSAVDVHVRPDKEFYGSSDVAVVTASIDMAAGERMPIQNLTLFILDENGTAIRNCTFSTGGATLSDCTHIVSVSQTSNGNYSNETQHYAYGYGYNGSAWAVGNQSFYPSSYGFGYGYAYGATGYDGEVVYEVTWNISAESLGEGNYSFNLWAHAADGSGNSRTYSDATPDTGDNVLIWDATAPSVTGASSPSGTVTTSTATLTVTTSEQAYCRFSTSGGVAYASMNSGTTSLGTTHSWSLTGLSPGNLNYYIRCADRAGNAAASDYTVSFRVSITSGSGGGGGATTSNVLASVSQVWFAIVAGEETTMNIRKEDISMTGVVFTLDNDAKGTSVTVTSLKSNPVSSIGGPSGSVYQHMQISVSNAPDVKKVTLDFRVENSWLVENGLSSEGVALYRLVGRDWVELPTTMVRSDGEYTYFEASSPGFSYFVVSQRGGVAAPQVTGAAVGPEPSVGMVTEPAPNVVITPSEPEFVLAPKERRTLRWIVISIVLVSIALFVVAYEFFRHNIFVPHHEREARKYVLHARSRGKEDRHISDALKKADWPEKKIHKLLKRK